MKKAICILIVLVVLLLTPDAYAHQDAGEHWEELRLVLFGDSSYQNRHPDSIKDKINILQYASQICIDQFGQGSCKASFTRLQQLKVTRLPKSIDDIALYASSNNHREYTHKGWDYNYISDSRNPDWSDRWKKRQNLFLSSVEKVFNFNGLPDIYDGVFGGYTEQCIAFTKLLYYVHLIGDHLEYTTYTYNRHKDQIMPLGGLNKDGLINHIIAVLPTLFPNQNCSELERELITINTKVCSVLNTPETLRNDISEYHSYAEELLNTLAKRIPTLLKNESYFNKVFP